MQNSFWKLISVVGVVAIGTMVVLEVQDQLPKNGIALNTSDSDTVDSQLPDSSSDVSVTAEMGLSEFEQHSLQTDSRSIPPTEDAPAFGALLQEPDLAGARTAAGPELSDNRDPFAADTFSPEPSRGTPVQSVGFSDDQFPEPTPTEDDDFFEFAVSADEEAEGESVPVRNVSVVVPVGNEVSQPDDINNPFAADPFDGGSDSSDPEFNDPFPADPSGEMATGNEFASDREEFADNRVEPRDDRLLFFPVGDDIEPDDRSGNGEPADDRGAVTAGLDDDPFAPDAADSAPPLRRLDEMPDDTDRERGLRALPDSSDREFQSPFDERDADPRMPLDTSGDPSATDEPDLLMFDDDEDAGSDPLSFESDLPGRTESREESLREDTSRFPADRSRFEDRSPLPDRSPIPERTPLPDRSLIPEDRLPGRSDFNPSDAGEREFPELTFPGSDDEFSDGPDFSEDLDLGNDRLDPRDRFQPEPEDDTSGRFRLDSDERREREFPNPGREIPEREFPDMDILPLQERDRSEPSDFRIDDRPSESDEAPAASSGVLRPHLTVTKQMQDTATLGVPLNYTLVVTNEGASAASDVVIEDVVPEAARVEQADPPADYDKSTRKLIWEFRELRAGESRELHVQLMPVEQGRLNSVATVRFKAHVATSTVVQAPQLNVVLKIPREVKVGSEVKLRYVVTNTGDGEATDVMLRSDLPDGLRNPLGNDLEYNIESMRPGEEREVELDVIAAEPGEFTSTAEILAAGMAPQSTENTLRIIGQQIQVVRRGPQRRYVGRSAVYENILTNETSFEASGIRVVERVPEGMKFDKASHNGVYNPQERAVTWSLAQIPAGETETLKIRLVAESSGDQESSVTVVENAGYETAARHVTAVEDLHNIGMRMSVLSGPVPVGREFGFDIVVQNRGTADATGVRLTIDLPDGIIGVSVGKGGPRANPSIESGQLQYHFEPVDRIAPGREMMFRINLKASKRMSNGIVNARISYDQMTRELVTSEAVTVADDAP